MSSAAMSLASEPSSSMSATGAEHSNSQTMPAPVVSKPTKPTKSTKVRRNKRHGKPRRAIKKARRIDLSGDVSGDDYAPPVQPLPKSKTPTDRASKIAASAVACRALNTVRRLHKGCLASYKSDYFTAELAKCEEMKERWRLLWPRIPALRAWVIQDRSRRWMNLTEDEYGLCFDYEHMGDNDNWPEFMERGGL